MYVIDFRVNEFYDLTIVKNLRLVKLCASQIIFGKIYPLEAAFPRCLFSCLCALIISQTQNCQVEPSALLPIWLMHKSR